MASSVGRGFVFAIDRGGTFTDVFAEVRDAEGGHVYRALKLLSEDPENYPDAPREGIRRILEAETGIPHPRDAPLDTARISGIRMGTTVATNALLERKGERNALVVTAGFRDLLLIGNQSRPQIFDLRIQRPDLLYEMVVEVDEEAVLPLGSAASKRNGTAEQILQRGDELGEGEIVTGITGEKLQVRKPLQVELLRPQLQRVLDAGIRSVAVVLKHSAIWPDHELLVGRLAEEMGFTQISLSSQVMATVKMVPRGYTAAADAYLTPHIARYIKAFQDGFDDGISKVDISFMQSDGGLSPVDAFCGHKAILSGPAGGYVGYALTTQWRGCEAMRDASGALPVVGFDMGGTSTDVSRYAGSLEHVFESTTAGVTVQAPQLDINTVAAGGGSRLFYHSGMFVVGPESAGAHPGPVCYRKNGHLAVTDANLALGRLLPDFFPHIFGPNEDLPLDLEGSVAALTELTESINAESEEAKKTADEVAMGFIQVANESMCRPIRELTQMKGFDVSTHVLACFGGAGGQHACAIARTLGMTTVFVHRYASILSAVGMGLADVVHDMPALNERLDELEARARRALQARGFSQDRIATTRFLNLRYDGTDVAVMTACPADGDYMSAFVHHYERECGFTLENRAVLVDDVRVRAAGRGVQLAEEHAAAGAEAGQAPRPVKTTSAYFAEGGRQDTAVYLLPDLHAGQAIDGPALLIDSITTVVVEPGCHAEITERGHVRIAVAPSQSPLGEGDAIGGAADVEVACDPIKLSIFSNRFMSIAEQMGRTLQQTSVSVNIKERLDFSCALFGPDGGLVANAPHLPVHLGAMSEAVKFQIRYYGPGGPGQAEGLREGDVLVTNHPQAAGGSHLPDITVVTPVFAEGRVVFFVASRGHHADVGGITPGSMPPQSTCLAEEGAAIVSFKLVRDHVFQEQGITAILTAPGTLADGKTVAGTRNLSDNLSDLKAQVAANTKGIRLLQQLVGECGLPVVQAYMGFLQQNAARAVQDMLHQFSLDQGLPEVGTVSAEDQMDDGSRICLAITINRKARFAHFDFTGTGPQVFGNVNAPPAVTYSAIIYALRCMVEQDIPLNQGCLQPVKVTIPEGCLLSPAAEAAVVGGNVLTSQRVTDVVLRAFQAAAASQGCMNNTTFGDAQMGYYETVAGGAGAGPGWHGCSGVQTHMTNTRITDPEILEKRYPVVLKQFQLRRGSGGRGRWNGGEGVVREIEFLRDLTVSVLTERRAVPPFGIQGGSDALRGQNLLVKGSGQIINLGGKASLQVHQGDKLRVITPGGGGYGRPQHDHPLQPQAHSRASGPAVAPAALLDGGSVSESRRRQESA